MATFFPYDYDLRFAPVWTLLGVRRGRDGVTITDEGTLEARYGPFRVRTPLANIASAQVGGPYRWYTAVGVRLSARDSGVTFGTTNRAGVCMLFHEKVRRVIGPRAHRGLTVTVADPEGLAAALESVAGAEG